MTRLMEVLKIELEEPASSKILCDNAFNIAKNPKCDGYQSGLASMVYKFFAKKILVSQTKNKLKNYTKQLLENLRKEKYSYLL